MSLPFIALAFLTGLGILIAVSALLPKRAVEAAPRATPGAPRAHRTLVEILAAALQPLAEMLGRRRQQRGQKTLADSLFQADVQLRASEFMLIQFACLAAGAVIGALRFGIGVGAAVMALAGYVAPLVYLRLQQGRRQSSIAAQLPDTLALLASGLRAGYSLPQALENVSRHAAPPISDELARVAREMSIGRTPEQALVNFERRAGSDDVELFVSAVLINSQVGGNLARMIDTITNTLRDRARVKSQISALTAQARASGTIITALPFAIATLLYFVAPDYFRPMFGSVIGLVLIGLSLISIGVGNVLIRRLARVEI